MRNLPRWSKDIVLETVRTLETKLGVTLAQTAHLVRELKLYFADAWVEGYEPLISAMTNHAKNRHVLVAAGQSCIALPKRVVRNSVPWQHHRIRVLHFVCELRKDLGISMREAKCKDFAALRMTPFTLQQQENCPEWIEVHAFCAASGTLLHTAVLVKRDHPSTPAHAQKMYFAESWTVRGELPSASPTFSTVPGSATPNNVLV